MQVQLSKMKEFDKLKLIRRGLLCKQGCAAYSSGARLQAEISYKSRTDIKSNLVQGKHLSMDAINNLEQEAVQGLYRKKQAREEAVRAATEESCLPLDHSSGLRS